MERPPRVIRVGVIDSTNLEARRLAEDGAELPLVVVAERQDAGRGRLGRAWSSPRGGLWCTLAWALDAPTAPERLGGEVGQACLDAVRDILPQAGPEAMLKAPNDVLVRPLGAAEADDETDPYEAGWRKAAGVLTEVGVFAGRPVALVGVGINLNVAPADLPESVRPRAASLSELAGCVFDTDAALGALLDRLVPVVRRCAATGQVRRANA